MKRSRLSAPGRWLLPALGALLFLLVFLGVFLSALPRDTLLSPVRSALSGSGLSISAREAGLGFPLSLRLTDATITRAGEVVLALDRAVAEWDVPGTFRGLPGRLRLARGQGEIDVRTSPRFWNPGRGLLRIRNAASTDFPELIPDSVGAGFSIGDLQVRWRRSSSGALSGTGAGTLPRLRIPIPAPDSPVREAVLENVSLKFTLHGDDIRVSTLTGTYEGSPVDGTGVITRVGSPSRSGITFHLRIRNPLEGKVATLFDLLSKNAKNANLRIKGTLLAPSGEFQFF